MGKVDLCPFPGKSVIGLTGVLLAEILRIGNLAKNGWEAISTDQLAGEIFASDKQVANLLLGGGARRFSMSGESLTKSR